MITLTSDQTDQIVKNFELYIGCKAFDNFIFDEGTLDDESCSAIWFRTELAVISLYFFDKNDSVSIVVMLSLLDSEQHFKKSFDFKIHQILDLFTTDCPIGNSQIVRDFFQTQTNHIMQ